MASPAWTCGTWIFDVSAHTRPVAGTLLLALTRYTAHITTSVIQRWNAAVRVNCVSVLCTIVLKNSARSLVRRPGGNDPTGLPRMSHWLRDRDGLYHTGGPVVTGQQLLALSTRQHASALLCLTRPLSAR